MSYSGIYEYSIFSNINKKLNILNALVLKEIFLTVEFTLFSDRVLIFTTTFDFPAGKKVIFWKNHTKPRA